MDTTQNDSKESVLKQMKNSDNAQNNQSSEDSKNVFVETMRDGMSRIFTGMKAVLMVAIASICIVGCKSVPSVEKIESVSRLAGTSAAMVVNMTKIDEQSKAVIIEIMNEVEVCVPQTNQTFTEVWTPIAKDYVAKLIADGKIDDGQGQLIVSGFSIVCNGIDYIFDVRYPKARQYKELVEAAVHGFISGYKSVASPSLKSSVEIKYDEEVFEYLKVKAGL